MENFAIPDGDHSSVRWVSWPTPVIQGSTSYYKTIPELRKMGNNAQSRHIPR